MIKILAVDNMQFPVYTFIRLAPNEQYTARDNTVYTGPYLLTVYPTGHVAISADESAFMRGINEALAAGLVLARDVVVQHHWISESNEMVACNAQGIVNGSLLPHLHPQSKHQIDGVTLQQQGSIYRAVDNSQVLADTYSK